MMKRSRSRIERVVKGGGGSIHEAASDDERHDDEGKSEVEVEPIGSGYETTTALESISRGPALM
jgi:hypothetical protein